MLWALLPAIGLLLAACAKNAPQDSLSPEGPVAQRIDRLFTPVFWIAAAIFFLVEGLLVFAVVHYRARGDHEMPKQVHGNKRLEIGWTLAPALLLAGVAVPTLLTLVELDRKPVGALEITVTAKQWWWQYQYKDSGVVTANELHIPTGRPVLLSLVSEDVIHSFWVPKLAGKQDVVPGRTNHLTLSATKPGTYLGQCAEFCALSHANMRLRVIAQAPADFERWVAEQKAPALSPADPLAVRGMSEFFGGQCIQCHTISGLTVDGKTAAATFGPNLTHFASRTTFGGATFDRTDQDLHEWLLDPQAAKPGNKMVIRRLTEDQIRALIAFLQSLR
jgi:cytochrome c oxidase subunit 2